MGTLSLKASRDAIPGLNLKLFYGGARRDRTADLLHAMQALSQLSYSPTRGGGILRERSFQVKYSG